MEKKTEVVVLLGSNIEPRKEYLSNALQMLEPKLGNLLGTSSVYESAPWGFEAETPFLNQTALFETVLSPLKTLEVCLFVENRLGRKRDTNGGYASRTLDVDILYYGDKIIEEQHLTVPHPRLHQRCFTLIPLNEMIPDFQHPLFKKTQKELLNLCGDRSEVKLFKR